jgi:N-acetylglucosaminyl-diphospho-decaprenol L-rhamnosyltransferase
VVIRQSEVQRPMRRTPVGSIAVVVVSFNTRDRLDACLESVLDERPSSVVVVDNASTDGSADSVRTRHPDVLLQANTVNVGYGAAANRGVAACAEPYVVLLNADTRLREGALAALGAELDEHESVAVVAPRLLNEDGTIQGSCFQFPAPLETTLRTTFLGSVVDRIPRLRHRYRYAYSPDAPQRVPWALGAALAIRREAFTTAGGFDESFFLYSEEVDLCYRLAVSGWETRFTPSAEVVHAGGASTDERAVEMEVLRYAATRRFYRKHYGRAARSALALLVSYRMLHNLCRDRARLSFGGGANERAALNDRLAVWRGVLREAWHE